MTALTANANTRLESAIGDHGVPMAASTTIYKGALVCLDSSGYAVPAADTAGYSRCIGVAREYVANTGSAGAKSIKVREGIYRFAATSITQAMVGTMMYVVDDNTIDDAVGTTNRIPVGPLTKYVSATAGYVQVGGAEARNPVHVVKSKVFDIDNGAGTTDDSVLIRHTRPITLVAARVVYTGATTGTVAAATVQLGVAVAGATLVAATNLENTKAVGTTTALTLAATAVAANTPVIARHTGVASTAAGEYHVELEYTINA